MVKKTKDWIKKHKKFIIAGVVTTIAFTATGIILILTGQDKNATQTFEEISYELNSKKDNESLLDNLTTMAEESDIYKTFNRKGFIRNLPEGQKASPKKLEEAFNLGILLKDGETLVDECTVKRTA